MQKMKKQMISSLFFLLPCIASGYCKFLCLRPTYTVNDRSCRIISIDRLGMDIRNLRTDIDIRHTAAVINRVLPDLIHSFRYLQYSLPALRYGDQCLTVPIEQAAVLTGESSLLAKASFPMDLSPSGSSICLNP